MGFDLQPFHAATSPGQAAAHGGTGAHLPSHPTREIARIKAEMDSLGQSTPSGHHYLRAAFARGTDIKALEREISGEAPLRHAALLQGLKRSLGLAREWAARTPRPEAVRSPFLSRRQLNVQQVAVIGETGTPAEMALAAAPKQYASSQVATRACDGLVPGLAPGAAAFEPVFEGTGAASDARNGYVVTEENGKPLNETVVQVAPTTAIIAGQHPVQVLACDPNAAAVPPNLAALEPTLNTPGRRLKQTIG